jgi:hypothetical protein
MVLLFDIKEEIYFPQKAKKHTVLLCFDKKK